MISKLVVNNVARRPIRTIVSVVAVALEVALVIVIVGLTSGMVQETAKRIEGVGADVMLQPPSASVFLAFSGAPMPIKIGDRLRQLKYVQAVAPVLLQFNSAGGIDVLYGIDPDSFRAVSGGFVFLQGHDMTGPDDVLVDDFAARSKNIAVDKASIFFLKCTRDEHTAAVMDEMRAILPGYEIRPLKDFLSLMTSTSLPGLDAFINSMIALAVAIGFLVIFLSMYTTVIERTRDIGVLKSLGASKAYIIRALLSEAAAICAVG